MGGAIYRFMVRRGPGKNRSQTGGGGGGRMLTPTAAPITLTVEFPSSGTMPQTAEAVLNTNGITDNSENSNAVFVGALPGGISTSGQNVTLTLPPYSVAAIH